MDKKQRNILIWSIVGGVIVFGVTYLIFRKKGNKGGSKKTNLEATDWSSQENFFNVNGVQLDSLAKNVGITMSRNKGFGEDFNQDKYLQLKTTSTIHWAVYDISNDKVIDKSSNASENIYGASVSKVVVSANAYYRNEGKLSNSDITKNIQLLVKSNNSVWDAVQDMGGGSASVNDFSKIFNLGMIPARKSGENKISALGMVKFWNDMCRNKFSGAESIFKITSSCQTSKSRSRKCIPKDCFIGGKTGTYKQYNHDTAWIQKGDKFYAIAVLTSGNNGSSSVATMFGGLFSEYCK